MAPGPGRNQDQWLDRLPLQLEPAGHLEGDESSQTEPAKAIRAPRLQLTQGLQAPGGRGLDALERWPIDGEIGQEDRRQFFPE
jgi:hypothetical protein